MTLFIGFVAAAIAGGLIEYIVGLFMPEKPRIKHILAIIGSIVIFGFVALLASSDIADFSTDAKCRISASEIELTSDVVEVNQMAEASIDASNPQGLQLVFDWSATSGSMYPGLRSGSNRSIFTAPPDAANVKIIVQISRPGCKPIERYKDVVIIHAFADANILTPVPLVNSTPVPAVARNTPRDIVIAIDSSGSMSGQPIVEALFAAQSFVSYIDANDQVAIVKFSDTATLVQSLTSNQAVLSNRIGTITEAGGTSIAQGLNVARNELVQNGRDTAEYYVILLTDGQSSLSLFSTVGSYINNQIDARTPR